MTASGATPAIAATAGPAAAAIFSHAGISSARNAATTRWVTVLGTTLGHRAGHHVAVDGPVVGDEVEQPQDPGARVLVDAGGRRGERPGDGGRDGVVAVGEVLIEDLPADACARHDGTDGQPVDGLLVCQRERRFPKAGADSLGTRVRAVCACCHSSRLRHFVDM